MKGEEDIMTMVNSGVTRTPIPDFAFKPAIVVQLNIKLCWDRFDESTKCGWIGKLSQIINSTLIVKVLHTPY